MSDSSIVCDVLIIGGGCAGTAAALSLRSAGIEHIVILEKSNFGVPRVGETIQPPTSQLLKELGLWETFLSECHLASSGSASAWGSSSLIHTDYLFNGMGNGWHLDRNRFDKMLLATAEKRGVHVFRNCETLNTTRLEKQWLIQSTAGDIAARFVIDATGRSCWFAKRQGSKKIHFDELHAVYTYWSPTNEGTAFSGSTQTLVESDPLGWWYAAALPNDNHVIAFMTDKSNIKQSKLKDQEVFIRQIEKTQHVAGKIRDCKLISEPSIKVATSYHLDKMYGDNWLAVGDCASAYDPLSSYGIHKALHWGSAIGSIVRSALQDEHGPLMRYQQSLEEEFESYILMKATYYQQESRWPDQRFWKSRQVLLGVHPLLQIRAIETSISNFKAHHKNKVLSESSQQLLLNLCQHPQKAYELVNHFQQQSSSHYPDWRIIHALSYLIDINVITSWHLDGVQAKEVL